MNHRPFNRRAFAAAAGAALLILPSRRSRAADPALDALIGRLLMINLRTAAPGPEFLEQLSSCSVGGVYLDQPSLIDSERVRANVSALNAAARMPLLIATDCEGGRVNRAAALSPFASARSLGAAHAAGDLTDLQFSAYVKAKAEFLKRLGLNINFDPVLDLAVPASPIGERSYGRDPARVAALARLMAGAYRQAGVLSTAKHFPGLGPVVADTHLQLPSLPTPADELRANDLAPFASAIAAGVPAIMVAHVRVNAVDPRRPASLSADVINGLLRRELGFRGIVIPDSLTMNAITRFYSRKNHLDRRLLAQRCVDALRAGADLLFNYHTPPAHPPIIVAAIREALRQGRLSTRDLEQKAARISSAITAAR